MPKQSLAEMMREALKSEDAVMEGAKLGFLEEVLAELEKRGKSRNWLADQLNWTDRKLKAVFSGHVDLHAATQIVCALGMNLKLSLEPRPDADAR